MARRQGLTRAPLESRGVLAHLAISCIWVTKGAGELGFEGGTPLTPREESGGYRFGQKIYNDLGIIRCPLYGGPIRAKVHDFALIYWNFYVLKMGVT